MMALGWACAAGKPRTASKATKAFPPLALAFALPLALPLAFAPAQGTEGFSEKRLEALAMHHQSVLDLLRRSRSRPGRKQVCNKVAEMVRVAAIDEGLHSGSHSRRLWNQLQVFDHLAADLHAALTLLNAEASQL